MATKSAGTSTLSPGQSQFVIDRLIADRRISTRDIDRYVSEMRKEIADLESRLSALRAAASDVAVPRTRNGPHQAPARKVSPEQRASRKLQGRYLGLIRQVPKAQRGKFQKIAMDEGREAAIRALTIALKSKK